MRAVLLVGALALAVGALTHSSARAEPAASTLLDVTFDCAVELRGGAYIVEARAHSGTRIGGRWGKLPYAGLRAGNFGGPGGNVFVWATSGVPTALGRSERALDDSASISDHAASSVPRTIPSASIGSLRSAVVSA